MIIDNVTRLQKAFSESLHIDLQTISNDLSYGKDWDSVAHMALVAALETEFNIMLETADVIDLSSFRKAKELLTKYGIQF